MWKWGWRGGPALSYLIPISQQHSDPSRPPLPWSLHSPLVQQPPIWLHFLPYWARTPWCIMSTSLVSTFSFLNPLPSAIHPLPTSTSRFLQQSIFSLAYTKTAKHSWKEPHNPTHWCHCWFMFSDLRWILNTIFQPVLSQLPLTLPLRAILNTYTSSPHSNDLAPHSERNKVISCGLLPIRLEMVMDSLTRWTTGLRWSEGWEAPLTAGSISFLGTIIMPD